MQPLDSDIVETGEWWEVRQPFHHFRATNVFNADVYSSLSKNFLDLLDQSAGSEYGTHRFTRSRMADLPTPSAYYDQLTIGVDEEIAKKFSPIFSESSIKSLCDLLSQPFLPRIGGEMHSNLQGCRTGYIHNDYSAAWFDESTSSPELMFPCHSRCEYYTGKPKVTSAVPREYPRSATLIYYLANDGWTQGDGGETALYNFPWETPETHVSLVPPINNSLVVFRCSPHSYHRFLANPGRVRNSIVLRLHTTTEFARSAWGPVPSTENL